MVAGVRVIGDGVSMDGRVTPHAMFAVEGVRYREVYGTPSFIYNFMYIKILGYVFKNYPGFKFVHNSTFNKVLFKT